MRTLKTRSSFHHTTATLLSAFLASSAATGHTTASIAVEGEITQNLRGNNGGCESSMVLKRLKGRVQGISSETGIVSHAELAGRYTAETDTLAKMIGGGFLAGSNLYLFADGRFIYSEWADVEPEMIYSQGNWSLVSSIVELVPDKAIAARAAPPDRHYVIFRFADGGSDTLRLMGTSCAVDKFDSFQGKEWRLALLMNSLELFERYTTVKESQRAFDRLVRRARSINEN